MMIENVELEEQDVGRMVVYIPNHAFGDESHPNCETGTIVSWNDRYVHVRYKSSVKSTYPKDLRWYGTSK